MLTATGSAAFHLAEVHRRLRGDLAALHTRVARLTVGPPARLDRLRSSVAELLDDVVLPLAAVEDELIDLVALDVSPPRAVHSVGRTEHDVVRELAAALREDEPVPGGDERTLGAIRAVDDLLPAHLAGEEQELLADLAILGCEKHDRLRPVVDLLPPASRGERPLARFHLPLRYSRCLDLLRSPHTVARLLPTEGLSVPSLAEGLRGDGPAERSITPLALIVGPDELALRFTLDERGVDTLWIDGRLGSSADGRSSVLELRATPPVRHPSALPPRNEIRRVVGMLGSALSRQLVRDMRGAACDRPLRPRAHDTHEPTRREQHESAPA